MKAAFDRSYADNILPDRMEKYIKELEDDLKLSETNIHEKTLLKPGISAKWIRFLYEEEQFKKKLTQKIEDLKNHLAEKIFEKRKESLINQQSFTEVQIKIEVERRLKQLPQYVLIKDELAVQDEVIRLINEAKQLISQLSFDIKNSIDILKLENVL